MSGAHTPCPQAFPDGSCVMGAMSITDPSCPVVPDAVRAHLDVGTACYDAVSLGMA